MSGHRGVAIANFCNRLPNTATKAELRTNHRQRMNRRAARRQNDHLALKKEHESMARRLAEYLNF